MRASFRLVSLSLLAASVATSRASAQRAGAFAHIDSVIAEELLRTETPGAAVALVSGDRVVYAKGFGRALADAPTPVTPATRFRIASATKVFTAATLVALAESGRADLNAPIGARLGEIAGPLQSLTPHQLLSHTAGLVMASSVSAVPDSATALADATSRVAARAAFTAPGEMFSYSNLGYQLAGRVIEVSGGKPYAEQVRQMILAPLGMAATSFDSADAARAGLALGAVDTPASAAVIAGGGPAGWPFAGLYSNVLDLARFATAFVNGGRLDGRQVLTPSSVARLAAPVAPFQSGEGDYAYGLRVYRHRGVDVVEHGGVDPVGGYRSLIYMVPSRHVAVVVLANRTGRRPYAIADAALDALLPGALTPAPATPAVVPMDSAEMARLVGRYAAGMVVEVSVDGGVLTLHQGPAAMPIDKLADGRYVARTPDGGLGVAFVPGAGGAVKYLHYNMRAFRRL